LDSDFTEACVVLRKFTNSLVANHHVGELETSRVIGYGHKQ